MVKNRENRQSVRKSDQQLTLLRAIFNASYSTKDETELLSRIVNILGQYYGESVVVAMNLLERESNRLVLRAFTGRFHQIIDGQSWVLVGQGVVGKAAVEQQPVLISDTAKCDFYVELLPNMRSELACPISYHNRLLGVLNLESPVPDGFTKKDLLFTEVVSQTVGSLISELRREKRLQEMEAHKEALLEKLSHDYQHIFENALQGMARASLEGKFLITNPALANLLGYDTPEELGRLDITKDIYVDNDDRKKMHLELEQKGIIDGQETLLRRRDGSKVPVKVYLCAVRDGRGNTLYYDGLIEDISSQKETQQAEQQRERVATMSELASAVAHEIRNPLGAVINASEELKVRINLTGTNLRLLEIILEEANRLERIVRDFLAFARPGELTCGPAQIVKLVETALQLTKQQHYLDAGVIVECNFQEDIPELIIDSEKLIQAFLYICINAAQALKRTGKILISVEQQPASATHGFSVKVSIQDNGPGIKPEHLGRVFEPFYSTKSMGTGLGLSIAKQIVEMHAGQIKIESNIGQGTKVEISIPQRNLNVT